MQNDKAKHSHYTDKSLALANLREVGSVRMPHVPLPEHDLHQIPHYLITVVGQGYFYCSLHPDVRKVNLESIEHHIKYKDPEARKSEILTFPNLLMISCRIDR